jgi:hypothetical protein
MKTHGTANVKYNIFIKSLAYVLLFPLYFNVEMFPTFIPKYKLAR